MDHNQEFEDRVTEFVATVEAAIMRMTVAVAMAQMSVNRCAAALDRFEERYGYKTK